MDSDSLHAWLDAYGSAWESRDPEKAASLFSEDALYFETPFSEPASGQGGVQEYWAAAVEGQRNVKFFHEVLAVSGHQGIARWWAEFTRLSSGKRAKLDGIFLLTFAENNLCRELREWWFVTSI